MIFSLLSQIKILEIKKIKFLTKIGISKIKGTKKKEIEKYKDQTRLFCKL
jgi:hypothetical protein